MKRSLAAGLVLGALTVAALAARRRDIAAAPVPFETAIVAPLTVAPAAPAEPLHGPTLDITPALAWFMHVRSPSEYFH